MGLRRQGVGYMVLRGRGLAVGTALFEEREFELKR
jgi:hypothetical protein